MPKRVFSTQRTVAVIGGCAGRKSVTRSPMWSLCDPLPPTPVLETLRIVMSKRLSRSQPSDAFTRRDCRGWRFSLAAGEAVWAQELAMGAPPSCPRLTTPGGPHNHISILNAHRYIL